MVWINEIDIMQFVLPLQLIINAVGCDRLRQKSWSPSSVSRVAARKIVRRSVLGPVRDIT